jgi:hypothetical protein
VKKLFIKLILFLCAITSYAQVTPNIGLRVPNFNAQNWNVPLNYNFTLLDEIISGSYKSANIGLQYRPIFASSAPRNSICLASNNGQEYFYTNGFGVIGYTCNAAASKWVVFGFQNPMTTVGDIIYATDNNGDAVRLPVGSNGQVLTVVSGVPTWQTSGASFPYPGAGIPYSTGSAWSGSYSTVGGGLYVPLVPALGSTGQFLSINSSGALVWAGSGGVVYPSAGIVTSTGTGWGTSLSTAGGGTYVPLIPSLGTNGQILGLSGGALAWLNAQGFANPMTASGDLIYGGTSGTPSRLGIGSNGQVLTLSSGLPVWMNNSALTNPMTTIGDIIYGGASGLPTRLGTGTSGQVLTAGGSGSAPSWTNPFSNPMTTTGDIIYGASGGLPSRLAIGASGYILQSNGSSPVWAANTALSNPMTGVGDMIYGSTGGAAARVPVGSAGSLLESNGNSGAPSWVSPSSISLGTATNLAGTTQYSIPYQSASATTSYLNPVIYSNYVIVSGGNGSSAGAPGWSALSAMHIGWASNLDASLGYYGLPIQENGSTAYIGMGNAGQFLQSNGGTALVPSWSYITALHPLSFADMANVAYTTAQVIARYISPVAQTIPASGTVTLNNVACTSKFSLTTSAAASTTITMAKNGSSFGTIVFASSGTVGTITISASVSVASGDLITFTGPGTADTTAAGLYGSLCSSY